MSLKIPECQSLSLEGIRSILFKLNENIEDLRKQQHEFKQEMREQIKVRPTMLEVVNGLSRKDPSTPCCTSEPIIRSIVNTLSSTVSTDLATANEFIKQHQEVMSNLVESIRSSLKTCHKKYVSAMTYSKTNLKYVHSHLQKAFTINKVSRIFSKWRVITADTRQGFVKLKNIEKHSTLHRKIRSFQRWLRNSSRISAISLQDLTLHHESLINLHTNELSQLQLQ